MAINCETKKKIIAYFTSIICGPFANDYSLRANGCCWVLGAQVMEIAEIQSGMLLRPVKKINRLSLASVNIPNVSGLDRSNSQIGGALVLGNMFILDVLCKLY